MANHRGVKLCKAIGQYTETEWQIYRCHEPYLPIFAHNLTLSGSSLLLSWYLLPLLGLWFCSTVQLGLSLWPRELDKPPRLWRWRRLLQLSETYYSWKEMKDKSLSKTTGKDCKGIILWPYFYAILLFFAMALLLEKSSCLLFVTDLNTASLIERYLTAAISYFSSVSVMPECW